jgi:hypothetical protein
MRMQGGESGVASPSDALSLAQPRHGLLELLEKSRRPFQQMDVEASLASSLSIFVRSIAGEGDELERLKAELT